MITRRLRLSIQQSRNPALRRPMMGMEAAKGILDRDDYGVVSLIGTWLIAWDISVPGAGRAERRMLADSVSRAAKFQSSNRRLRTWKWNDVLALVLPRAQRGRPWISGVEIRRCLNCSSKHVMRLIECGALELRPCTTYRKGPGGSPHVNRESFARFLQQRLEDLRNVTDFPTANTAERPETQSV
jgi:hypothetical protein